MTPGKLAGRFALSDKLRRFPMVDAAAPVIDEIVELRGLRFHYRDWASVRADAPVLVVLHGYTSHARSWDAFAAGMTDRYRVVALDQRGHGQSDWAPADRYGIEDMADDLAALVSALGLEYFSLLGLSMGGMVTMEYAGRRPPELAAAVIVDIGPELIRAGSQRIGANVAAADIFPTREAAFAAARADNPRPPEAHHRQRVYSGLMRTADGQWTFRYDRALRSAGALRIRDRETAWRSCAAIGVPTQIIRGEQSDLFAADVAARMVETIADARLVEVKNAGHSVPLDAPEGFLAAARTFLTG
jgi:pimeloyl-ACP methyl ester carboxylesterase